VASVAGRSPRRTRKQGEGNPLEQGQKELEEKLGGLGEGNPLEEGQKQLEEKLGELLGGGETLPGI
jgi:hypothetical protein